MFTRLLPLPLIVLVAVLLAGCGGGSAKLKADDVALVGNSHVNKKAFDALIAQARFNIKNQGLTFPKAGTTQYLTIQSQAVTLLIQDEEKQIEAESLGIKVTEKQIDTRLAQIKKQYFNNNAKTYQAQLDKAGLTEANVRDQIKSQLRDQAIFDKLTKDVTVNDVAVFAYWVEHKSDYQTGAARDVHYILVGKNKQTLASSIVAQIKHGGDWCKLAAKYSLDTTSSAKCGKATFTKGQTVPAFDSLLFKMTTGTVQSVNTPQYGWFVLSPISKAKAASTTPEAKAAPGIKQKLLQDKKNKVMVDWVDKIGKSYCNGKKLKYQVGYTPSPDPCAQYQTTSTTGT